MTETTNNTKLTKKKWFQWTLGISGVAVVALAITLPIVLLSGDSGKKQFDTKQQVWSTMVVNTTDNTRGGFQTTSEDAATTQSQAIVDGLSLNTAYKGWYSETDYRGQTEFINFQNEWIPKLKDGLEYSTSIISGLPTLPDDPTTDEVTAFSLEMEKYFADKDQTKSFFAALNNAVNAIGTTTFSNDFGSLQIYYFGSEETYSITATFSGTIAVSQEEINSGSENLPDVYQFNQEIQNGWTNLVMDYASWMDENLKGLFTEERWNSILVFNSNLPTYTEMQNIYSVYSEIIFDTQITNIISN